MTAHWMAPAVAMTAVEEAAAVEAVVAEAAGRPNRGAPQSAP